MQIHVYLHVGAFVQKQFWFSNVRSLLCDTALLYLHSIYFYSQVTLVAVAALAVIAENAFWEVEAVKLEFLADSKLVKCCLNELVAVHQHHHTGNLVAYYVLLVSRLALATSLDNHHQPREPYGLF